MEVRLSEVGLSEIRKPQVVRSFRIAAWAIFRVSRHICREMNGGNSGEVKWRPLIGERLLAAGGIRNLLRSGRRERASCVRLQEVHNPILCPVGIFSVVCPVKEPAMASVARRDHPNLRVALNQRHRKHGVGNEGIILCCDDEGGDGDGIEHTACA